MNNDIVAQQDKAERNAKLVEVSLINHGPVVDKVLEACRRIDWGQKQLARKGGHNVGERECGPERGEVGGRGDG